MKVCVVGLGYIGLPTAAIIARKGFTVIGVDISKDVVNTINRGEIHIIEPELDKIVHSAVMNQKFVASTNASEADVFIIAVPTPFKRGDNSEHIPDLSYIKKAVELILPVLRKGNLLILESTSPVDTTESLLVDMLAASGFNAGKDIFLAYCPERVLPGKIIKELIENDRVIGGINQKSSEKAKEFYKRFIEGDCFITNSKTAELVKLVENSYRDVNIAFANELSVISAKFKIDVYELVELANKHPRVNILLPGPGVGGHCIAVDPWFIVDSCSESAKLIHSARLINDAKPDFVIENVLKVAKNHTDSKIACFGLSYKANIDDLRESPSLYIAKKLSEYLPNRVICCEPNRTSIEDLNVKTLEDCLTHADIILFLVAHSEFKKINMRVLKKKKVFDFCGLIHEIRGNKKN